MGNEHQLNQENSQSGGVTGLVLSGGGARGAYQAGVLEAMLEMAAKKGVKWPFPIITGTSAGSINAAYMGCKAHLGVDAGHFLKEIWNNITVDQVYKDDIFSLSKIGFKWFAALALGGINQKKSSLSLLNTAPLRKLLNEVLDMKQLEKNVQSEILHAVSLTAMNYSTGTGQTFYTGPDTINPWKRHNREGIPSKITVDHVMASSAIPIIFPPVKIGPHFYGDGNLRDYTPLGPAINLGATRLIVVGVKKNIADIQEKRAPSPSLARILSVVLNTILLDSLDLDMERLDRINEAVAYLPKKAGAQLDLRRIEVCTIRPSENIGEIATQEAQRLPLTVQHLLQGLGTREEASELISYLLFMPAFTRRLTQLGYKDAYAKEEELLKFLVP
jgi:NTE family protein